MNLRAPLWKIIAWCICVYAVLMPFSAYGVDIGELDDEIEETQDEIEQREGELEQSEGREYLYMQEGLSITEKLAALDQDLAGLEENVASNSARLEELAVLVEEAADETAEAEYKYEQVSLSLYKQSRIGLIDVIFSSTGLSDLVRQMGFRRYGISHILGELRTYRDELRELSAQHNALSLEVETLEDELSQMEDDLIILEGQRAMYAQLAEVEASRQQQIVGEIANITAEQQQLIAEKTAAMGNMTVGEYDHVQISLPDPPFSPAYAIASLGFPHRVGMSQYGAYGRAKEGQTYREILSAYYNADFVEGYDVPDRIYVDNYCVSWDDKGKCNRYQSGWMDFEGQYLKGIAEMPTYWADSGGYEALKAQAVIARSYAIKFTGGGAGHICADEHCQVYYHPKVSDPAAAKWHDAVADTRGKVLMSGGQVVSAYYCSTVGGYTRLTNDFWECKWMNCNGTNPSHIKRVADIAPDGKAYDGPGHGDSSWYYASWYFNGKNFAGKDCWDGHPWLTEAEMKDMLNSALLSDGYNSHLSHPDLGGWSHERVRTELIGLGIDPISDISSISVLNSSDGSTAKLLVGTSQGQREVVGSRFHIVFSLRSRGCLVIYSSLYDVIVR